MPRPQSPVAEPAKALLPPNKLDGVYQDSQATYNLVGSRTPQASSNRLLHYRNNSLARQPNQGLLPSSGQSIDARSSQALSVLASSSGFFSPSLGNTHPVSDDNDFLFFDELDDSHITLNLSELANLGVVNSYGDSAWPFLSYDVQNDMKDQSNSDFTSGTEDTPETPATPAASHELASDIGTSQPLFPNHSAWKPSMQTNPLRTSSAKKRKAIALDDDFHSRASKIRPGGDQFFQNRKLACPFYKMNPKRYMRCGERSLSNISALGQHFSKAHKPKLLHCKDCFESFDDKVSEQRHEEPGACVPTGGCSVDDLRGPRGKHEGPAKTWYCYWEQLFPNLAPPASPHTDGLDVLDQCMLSTIQRVILPLGLETSTETSLVHELSNEIARWRQHSAEPLDHAQLRQYGRLPTTSAGSWQEGRRQPTPIRVS